MTEAKLQVAWQDYEEQVFRLLKEHLPHARLRKNVKIRGRYSGRKRQIDVLISEPGPSGRIRTVVDAKYFGRKVTVPAVDGLAGFVEEIGADAGMLVTARGYSRAALRRAYYGPTDLELDVLNFSELKQLQGFGAIPYAADLGLLIRAPLGWVIDASKEKGRRALLYQRGLDAAEAAETREFIYINCWDRRLDSLTVQELDELQVETLRSTGSVDIRYVESTGSGDSSSRLRVADVDAYRCLEVTGFVEREDAIFFATLLTPRETQRQNIRRLESVLRYAMPVKLRKDNSALIREKQSQLDEASESERVTLLREIGHWYRDMGDHAAAREALEECLTLEPKAYHAAKELIPVLMKLDDKAGVVEWLGRLLRLDPRNPTVFDDTIDFVRRGPVAPNELVTVMDDVAAEHEGDELVRATVDFYVAQLLAQRDSLAAIERASRAEEAFRRVVPRDHYVFATIRELKRSLREGTE